MPATIETMVAAMMETTTATWATRATATTHDDQWIR